MSFADIPLSSQTAPVIEFEVLWTPQRHQKNKKWHDGFMKLHTFNNRLMVTDEDRNPICNKFHTDGARIDVEDTIIFENHIVEVLGVKGQTEQDLRALFEKTAERRQAIGRSDGGTPASSRASPPPTLPRNLKPPPGNMIALNRGGGRRVGLTRSASGVVAARPPAMGSGLGRGRSLSGVLGGQQEPRQRQTNQVAPQMPPPPVPRTPALQQRRQPDDTPAVPLSKAAVSAFKPPMSAQTATVPQQHQQPQVIHKTPQQPAPRKLNQTKKTKDTSRANIPQRTFAAKQPLPPPKNTPIKESPSTVPIKESPASTRNDVVDISSDEGEEDKDMAQYTNAENTIRRNREQRESQLANWDNQFRRLKSNSPTPQQPRKQPRKQAKTRPREPPQQQQPQQERQVRQIQQEEEEQLQPTSNIPSKRGRDEFEDEHEDDDMDDDDLAAIEEAVKRNREALQRSDLSSPVSEEQPQQQVAPEVDMTDEPEVTVQVEEARQEPAAAATATTTVTATATATVNNKEAGPPRLLQLQSVTTKEPRRMLLCRPTKEKSSNIPSRNVSDLGFKNLSFEDKDKVDEDAEDSEEVPIAAQKTRKTKAATKAATAKKPAKAAKVSKTTKANKKKAAETEQNVELTNDEADNQEQPNATKRPKKTRATKKKVTISEPNAGAQTTEAEESEQPAPRSRKKLKQSATTADTDPKGKKKAQPRRRGKKASPETVEIPSSPPPAAVDEANYEPVGKNTEDQEIEDNFDIASSPFIGTNVFDGIESTAQAMRVPTPEPIIEEEQEEEEDPFADFPKQGPWTVEAYDLFSWRPPGKEGLFL